MSVCSLRLTRVKRCPAALANALIRDVFPTPGEPSSKMGLVSCMARSTRAAFRRAEGAVSSNSAFTAPTASRGSAPRGTANGATPKTASSSTNAPSRTFSFFSFFVARFGGAGDPRASPLTPPGFEAASIA